MRHGYPTMEYFGAEEQCKTVPIAFPPQHQRQHPGLEWMMRPRPIYDNPAYRGSGKLAGKVALITGGDSGIGRAVAVAFAKEGADVAIVYLYEHEDAAETAQVVEALDRRCVRIAGDLRDPQFCREAVAITLNALGRLDVLVNNAAVQYVRDSILEISDEQLERTFRTNIFPLFYLTKAALPHLSRGSSIISTASVVAYTGEARLLDYSATKGAIVTFTRSLALQLVEQGIRVNAVAPGPIWTPLTVSSWSAEQVKYFGTGFQETPMQRAGQPFELAPAYVYLASDDSGYVTGEVLHVNGGMFRTT